MEMNEQKSKKKSPTSLKTRRRTPSLRARKAFSYFLENRGKLENKVYVLPKKLDQEVASLKLQAMGISIDRLTKEQKKYLSSWDEGTK